jgi:non-canonical (house-cleaning) NTP pyrophosphatase
MQTKGKEQRGMVSVINKGKILRETYNERAVITSR